MHIRCPHCRNPIEVVDDDQLQDLTCPSCGSSFNLLPDDTISRQAVEHKTLGRFELVERIGVGAFGEVWTARDSELDRIVAIKMPRKDQLTAEEAESFLREARSAARLHHPSIVAVHEVGKEDDQLFIVSDYVHGLTLADWLTGKRPSPKEAAELCAKIADAVEHAHENGVIHRDLKPSNIMLDDDGQPHIMDFGLAKRDAGEITMTVEGRVLGTPAYMSPQQAKGEGHDADQRSDVYSLGVILFELLTGELPFRGNARMLIHQVINEEPPGPRRLSYQVPVDLDTVCLKCLEKDPDKRYQTAGELCQDLGRFLHGVPIKARPVSTMERGWRWCKRNPVVAGLLTTIAVLLAGGAVVSSSFAIIARNKAQEAKEAKDVALDEAERNRRLRYVGEMNMAKQSWDENDVARTKMLLRQWQPAKREEDLRGFEWFYLTGLISQSELSCTEFSKGKVGAYFVDLSKNHDLAVAHSNSICVYDLEGGTEENYLFDVEVFNKPWLAPSASPRIDMPSSWHWPFPFVAISADGQLVAYRGDDPSVLIVRHRVSNRIVRLTDHQEYVRAVAFDRDGQRVLSGSGDGKVFLWDLMSPEKAIRTWHFDALVWCVALSPDGSLAASGLTDNTIRISDVETGEVETLSGHFATPSTMNGVLSVAFSSDGRFLVSGGVDRTVRLWDMTDRKLVGVMAGHSDEVRSVAVSPDGTTIASGSRDHSIRLWDVLSLRPIAVLKGHDSIVQSVGFNSDGDDLYSCGQDGNVRKWSDIKDQGGDVLWCDGAVSGLAISPDGNIIAATQQYSSLLRIWYFQSRSQKPVLRKIELGSTPEAVAISSKGLCAVACEDSNIRLLEVPSGELVTIHPGKSTDHAVENGQFTFSPDGTTVAMACRNGRVRIWLVNEGEQEPLNIGAQSLAFGSDSQKLYVGCGSGVKVWDFTMKHFRTMPDFPSGVQALSTSPNGDLLAIGKNRISVWDVKTGKQVANLVGGRAYTAIAFLDDRTIVSSGGETAIRLWDLEHRRPRFTFTGHRGSVRHLHASEDGHIMVSGGRDGSIRIWRAAEQEGSDVTYRLENGHFK